MYSGISVEKYNLMKPSKQKKSSSTIKRLRDYISTNGKHLHPLFRYALVWCLILGTCGNCIHWKTEASEIQDEGRAQRCEVAMWSPVLGFAVKDDLFPHVSGGLRGRRVTITSIEVIFYR